MCQYLPTRNFVEIEVTRRKDDDLLKSILDTKDDHKQRYFLEYDSEYPQNIQRKTNKTFSFSSRDEKTIKMKSFSKYMMKDQKSKN